jgi:hypothetical protein
LSAGLGRNWAATVLALSLYGCTLTEVVVPEADDLLVVEAVLRPDQSTQRVLLHSALASAPAGAEQGARVVVRTAAGREIVFAEVADEGFCIEDEPLGRAACYVSPLSEGFWVQPGQEYRLRVETRDGRVAFGTTRVPGDFRLYRPRSEELGTCNLPPDTALPLSWSPAAGAWAYIAEMEVSGLRTALAGRVPGEIPDSVRLTGLAITETDTTMVLPRDFGIFQRFDFDQPLLLALRDGLPRDVRAFLVVAAVDRNYVNAVRGGTFNPSGRVRIPSVAGDATGMFGSMVVRRVLIQVGEPGTLPSCLEAGG